MTQVVRNENDDLLYLDDRCPISSALPFNRNDNFAETEASGVIRNTLKRVRAWNRVYPEGYWVVVAWGRVSGTWCSPVGLLRAPSDRGEVDFTFFEHGRQDFRVMRSHANEYPGMIQTRLNRDESLVAGRNLLRFPYGDIEESVLIARMVDRIFH